MSTRGPEESRLEQNSSRVLSGVQISYSGPLPPPEILEKYERLVPGSAERLFQQFEQQTAHRHTVELRVIKSNTLCQVLGSISALLLSLLALGGGLFLVHEGQSIAGLAALLGALASLVAIFIYGRRDQDHERSSKVRNGRS